MLLYPINKFQHFPTKKIFMYYWKEIANWEDGYKSRSSEILLVKVKKRRIKRRRK